MSYKRKTKIDITKTHQDVISKDDLDFISKEILMSGQKTTHQQYLKMFKEVTEKMYQTTEKKNHDYATENDAFRNFRDFGLLGVLVRMSDKFARLKTALVEGREFKVNESVIDTVTDLAVYSVILRIMIESGEFKK